MSNELKECPFCGGEAKAFGAYDAYAVNCASCNAYGPSGSKANAIAAWNRRSTSGAASGEVAIERQDARWAIGGAIAYGRMGVNPPPSEDHWLCEYWQIGQQLAKLGETCAWDNVTPIAPAEQSAPPVPRMSESTTPVMTCPQCGVDRLKSPCPGMAGECAMVADAHLIEPSLHHKKDWA